MQDHFIFSDEAFEKAFENKTLAPHFFDHEAHLRLAYIHIQKYGIDQAIQNMCTQIKAYAESLGAYDKFHKTVTVAAVKAVYHFMLKTETDNFKEFIHENPRLKTNFMDLLSQHYGIDLFNNEQARLSFLQPDLLPFD